MGNIPGWEFDVVSLDPYEAEMAEDHSLESYVKSHFGEIVRVDSPVYLRPLGGRFPCRFFPKACQRPDLFRFYKSKAVVAASSLDLTKYDIMVSRSQWHSSHLVAAELKGVYPELPWVVSMSDPWADSPFRQWRSGLREVNEALERNVLEGSDAVVVPSEYMASTLKDRYPSGVGRIEVVPHAYDSDLGYEDSRRSGDDDPVVMRCLGTFYGARTPDPLFQALVLLQNDHHIGSDDLRVEIIGSSIHSLARSPALEALPDGLVALRESVDHLAALGMMSTADVLIVIEAPLPDNPLLPAKLVDYLGSGTPVLGVAPEGEVARILRNTGDIVADPSDVPGIANAILKLINDVKQAKKDGTSMSSKTRNSQVQTFNIESIGPRLSAVFEAARG